MLKENNISIAHSLPSNGKTLKLKLARFTRRVTKIGLLRKRKNQLRNSLLGNVRIFEEATKTCVKFMNLLRNDKGVNKAWIKMGQNLLIGKKVRA